MPKANPGVKPLTGGSAKVHTSKAAPNTNNRLPDPARGMYKGPNTPVRSGKIPNVSIEKTVTGDYAGDGKTYGVGGSKSLGGAAGGKMRGN